MLPAACSRRLVTELQGALGACQKTEKELEQSLGRCRALLQPCSEEALYKAISDEIWILSPPREVASPPSPEPASSTETNPECDPTPKDLKEVELLTQALEKALRVRKGITQVQSSESASSGKAAPPPVNTQAGPGARPRTSNPKARVPARSSATSQRNNRGVKTSSRASSHRGRAHGDAITHAKLPDNSLPIEGPAHLCPIPPQDQVPRLPTFTPVSVLRKAGTSGPSLEQEQGKIQPSLQSEAFMLKEKGTQLQLPLCYKKIASRNSSLWAQIQHSEFSADADVAAAKAHFLERMKTTFDLPGPEFSPAEIQKEVIRLDQACHLLNQHLEKTLGMGGEAATATPSWEQEYRRLVTLEGLQASVDRHLLRLQELREAEERWLGPRPVENSSWGSAPCLGGVGSSWPTNCLFYSNIQELQTMMTLKFRVAMLNQQIHLQKVLMEELLPLVRSESPAGPIHLELYRAVHSQLCEAGEHFSILVKD